MLERPFTPNSASIGPSIPDIFVLPVGDFHQSSNTLTRKFEQKRFAEAKAVA